MLDIIFDVLTIIVLFGLSMLQRNLNTRVKEIEDFLTEEEEAPGEDRSAHITGMKESILEFGVPYDESLIPEDFEGTCVFTDRTVKVTQEEENQDATQ